MPHAASLVLKGKQSNGGDDDPGGYVDYLYTENVDGVRANGMRVGHYWFVGPQLSPEDSADFIQANIHDLQTGDVIALDNEGDGLWTDAQATAFFNEFRRAAKHLDVYPSFTVVKRMGADRSNGSEIVGR